MAPTMSPTMYYHHQLPLRQSSPVAIKIQIPTTTPYESVAETTDFESETEYAVPSMKQRSRVAPPSWPSKKQQSPESLETLYSKAVYMMEALSDSDSSGDQSLYSKSTKTATTISSVDGASTPDNLSFTKLSLEADRQFGYETPDTDDYDFAAPSGVVTQGPKGPHLFFSPEDERKLFMDPNHRPMSTISAAIANLDSSEYGMWSTTQVCAWMKELGFDDSLVSRFKENDVSGIVLSELKWEDLKELDIQSFGKRIELWSAVNKLRGGSVPSSPARSKPSSPILESPRSNLQEEPESETSEAEADRQTERHRKRATSTRRRREHRRVPQSPSVVMPEDSVSMRAVKLNSDDDVSVAPQVPKPRKHKCTKGAKCAKHGRKHKQHHHHSAKDPDADMSIVVGATPSVVQYGFNMFEQEVIEDPNDGGSIVPSSDALGGIGYELELKAEALREVKRVDPQENVRHFVALQHLQSYETASSPIFKVPDRSNVEIMRSDLIRDCSTPAEPFDRCKTPALGLRTQDLPPMPFGYGISRHATQTPFSDFDVPRTFSTSPVYPARDLSSSVPPDMRYRQQVDGPSFNQLPAINTTSLRRTNSPVQNSPTMSPVEEHAEFEHFGQTSSPVSPTARLHVGFLKKRRTNLFRHEYKTYHCRLQGTRLGFYSDELSSDEVGFIDMNYYTVGCASGAKPAGVWKVHGKSSDSDGNFLFQLIPNMDGGKTKGHGVGKIHHIAVISKEERYTWMRELLLCKIAGKKDSGFAVEINGNMI